MPGERRAAPATATDQARLRLSGRLVPQLALVAAALALLAAALLDVDLPPVAGAALGGCLALTALQRSLAARVQARESARLRRSEAVHRALATAEGDVVLTLDGDLRIRQVTPAVPGLPGRPLTGCVPAEDAAEVRARLLGPQPAGARHTLRLLPDTGLPRVLETTVSDLRADPDVRALVVRGRDVTARDDRERELCALAYTDPLTGLPNRAAQERSVHEDLAAGTAGLSLLLVEVHGLRAVHEDAGRSVVDAALVEVARRLRATVRGTDEVSRVDAELFAVLASGTPTEVGRLAARCLAVLEAPIVTAAGLVDLCAVVGLAPLSPGLTAAQVQDHAELALAAARSAGTGSVHRHHPELTAVRDRRDQLRHDLVGARGRGELELAWLPVVDLTERRVAGVEALMRWRHPDLGDVPPEEFLPVAARAGLTVDLQRWVLQEATRAVVGLPQSGPALRLGVNVSAAHLAAGTLVADVTRALADSGLPPERLVVELAESALSGPRVRDDVSALRLMGVHVALDDVGRGASSLADLGRLPVDVLKLDRTLLARIDRDPYVRAVCAAVVTLGATLGVDVVAEGVETVGQLAVLHNLGCGFAQGFLLSRPVGLIALTGLLEADGGRLWPGVPAPRPAPADGTAPGPVALL
ncbi:phosphodiesterase [Modestobacter sp. VKM Ac-2986]|uniref:putative bifunctional diguanylate cyclase/phosphodiesterase n=1 Tax=Modestobacter sp. VKM Ac-2986 TaxID=3004140 RepID=UPI0022AB93E1|nr:phosphodiesterase [Modestobacter sp. VKM Ac-2986]MCZ2829519.1 phosphodiesterase [Modestobacter sp. VKM Ac-2986]